MNEQHAHTDDDQPRQRSTANQFTDPTPTLRTTTTLGAIISLAEGVAENATAVTADVGAAAASRAAAAAAARATAAQTMTYEYDEKRASDKLDYPPKKSSSLEYVPPGAAAPPRKGSDQRKGSNERKGSAKDRRQSATDDDDADRGGGRDPMRRRDSFIAPVDPQEVMKFLQQGGPGSARRPIAHIGTTVGDDRLERLPERRLKEMRPPAVKDLYADNEKIKQNRSYKLRYNFLRRQGAVPSSMQHHLERFKKPPFKRVWRPGWCVDNLSDRLARLAEKRKKL